MNNQINLKSQLILECNQERSLEDNNVYDWTNEVGEVIIDEGDEISVYQSFINVRGASNETIAILDDTINGENPTRTPIELQYYKNNNGLNSIPCPYSFNLLSLGTHEPDMEEKNKILGVNVSQSGGGAVNFTGNITGTGMYFEGNSTRNVSGGTDIQLLSNLAPPIDSSRYTLMETYRTEEFGMPFVRHRVLTGRHTFTLDDNYYTPQNLADNLTKSINNSTQITINDEFDKPDGIALTSSSLINTKGFYVSRKYYGGTDARPQFVGTTTAQFQPVVIPLQPREYQPKSLYGFDLIKEESSILTGSNYRYNTQPLCSEYFFLPAPSWDFYAGTSYGGIGSQYVNDLGNGVNGLREHTNLYFKNPESLVAGENLFNAEIYAFGTSTTENNWTGSDITAGTTGFLRTQYTWTESNLNLWNEFMKAQIKEDVFEGLKVRNYNQSLGGTQTISFDKNKHRAITVSIKNPTTSLFGTITQSNYYGFYVNNFGHNYGCDLGGIGSISISAIKKRTEANGNISTTSVSDVRDFANFDTATGRADFFYQHSLNTTIGSYISNQQLVSYNDVDGSNIDGGYGFMKKISFSGQDFIGFECGSSEGGLNNAYVGTYNGEATGYNTGWFPKFTDRVNSALIHINPDGLGSITDRFVVSDTDGGLSTITYPRDLSNTGEITAVTSGSFKDLAKGWSSSSPNVSVGAIYPIFGWDNDISRFSITNLYTPNYIRNEQTASNTNNPKSQGGTAVSYINPVYQETENRFINRWANHTPVNHSLDNRQLKLYLNNAMENRNTYEEDMNKVIIDDSYCGVYISKWSVNDTEETWSNSLFSKMGFSYASLHSSNNRQFRNEDYVLGSNPRISNPITNNANIDTLFMNQLSRNAYNLPTYYLEGCGDVLQREILSSSTEVISDELPIKNFTPYYIICSDILLAGLDEYRQSSNILPAIDVCSLNYNSSDYYYAEPSQLIHTAGKRYRLSSINTVVRRPDGKLATELSGASSIMYRITKSKVLPPFNTEEIAQNLLQLSNPKTLSSAMASMDRLQGFKELIRRGEIPIPQEKAEALEIGIEEDIEEYVEQAIQTEEDYRERFNQTIQELRDLQIERDVLESRINTLENINEARQIQEELQEPLSSDTRARARVPQPIPVESQFERQQRLRREAEELDELLIESIDEFETLLDNPVRNDMFSELRDEIEVQTRITTNESIALDEERQAFIDNQLRNNATETLIENGILPQTTRQLFLDADAIYQAQAQGEELRQRLEQEEIQQRAIDLAEQSRLRAEQSTRDILSNEAERLRQQISGETTRNLFTDAEIIEQQEQQERDEEIGISTGNLLDDATASITAQQEAERVSQRIREQIQAQELAEQSRELNENTARQIISQNITGDILNDIVNNAIVQGAVNEREYRETALNNLVDNQFELSRMSPSLYLMSGGGVGGQSGGASITGGQSGGRSGGLGQTYSGDRPPRPPGRTLSQEQADEQKLQMTGGRTDIKTGGSFADLLRQKEQQQQPIEQPEQPDIREVDEEY